MRSEMSNKNQYLKTCTPFPHEYCERISAFWIKTTMSEWFTSLFFVLFFFRSWCSVWYWIDRCSQARTEAIDLIYDYILFHLFPYNGRAYKFSRGRRTRTVRGFTWFNKRHASRWLNCLFCRVNVQQLHMLFFLLSSLNCTHHIYIHTVFVMQGQPSMFW